MAAGHAETEQQRLTAAREQGVPWYKWDPYLSERQWGTVREDYSDNGDAWSYCSHDQARERAYHWGEDVKEYYFYLDSTPTHSYMQWLYKYPQAAYPYEDLVATNRRRSRLEFEYELLDTGVFNQDRYWDVVVEYAKAAPEDVLIQITVINRGPDAATLHVLPTLWFRNTWAWWPDTPKPGLRQVSAPAGLSIIAASHAELGERWLYVEGNAPVLFTENETNTERPFGTPNASPYVKDGINRYLVEGCQEAVNPGQTGTKAAVHWQQAVGPGESAVVRLRLADRAPGTLSEPSPA
jgi:hypothetical protein